MPAPIWPPIAQSPDPSLDRPERQNPMYHCCCRLFAGWRSHSVVSGGDPGSDVKALGFGPVDLIVVGVLLLSRLG